MQVAVAAKKRRASSPSQAGSSVKRADVDVVATEPTALALAALLKQVCTSIDGAMNRLMNLPCQDNAARGRIVAELSQIQEKIGLQLGTRKKNIRDVLGNDPLPDIFAFLRRSELDTLQLVDTRFRAIIEDKMSLICIRRVTRASMKCRASDRLFELIIRTEDAKNCVRFGTGVTDEGAAFAQLLGACRSSQVHLLEMYGDKPLTEAHIGALSRHAPSILMGHFRLGVRVPPESISKDHFLQAVASFAELRKVDVAPEFYTTGMQCFLVRNGYMFEVGFCKKFWGSYVSSSTPKSSVDEASLLHFSFAKCDDRWVTRERRLSLWSNPLTPSFLQRWIKKAEEVEYLHRLTLDVDSVVTQNLHGLDIYRTDGGNDSSRKEYHSTTGRPWTVIYHYGHLKFSIR